MLGKQVDKLHQLGDPVGFWLMNEGTGSSVWDLSGNNNTGTITGALWTPGKFGSAIKFANTTDYIDWGDILDIGSGNMSWVIGVRFDSYINASVFLDKRDSAGSSYYQFKNTTTGFQFLIHDGTNLRINSFSDTSTDDMQLVVVYDQTDATAGFKVYKDSVLKDTAVTSSASISNANSFSTSRPDVPYTSEVNYNYLYVYDRALSASEIELLYREPFCMMQGDMPVSLMYSYAAGGNVVTPYYYRGAWFLPVIPAYYLLRRRKCAA